MISLLFSNIYSSFNCFLEKNKLLDANLHKYALYKAINTIIVCVYPTVLFFALILINHMGSFEVVANNELLLNTLKMLKNARIDYLINVSKALSNLGYKLNVDTLKKLPTVTKAHIAIDIINNEFNKDILIKTFNHIPTMGEFIETIMNENCPAYVEKFSITPKHATEIIKQANGKVVLAHPVAYIHEDNLTINNIDSLIKEIKCDGIEANYVYVDKRNNIFDDSAFWNEYASKNNLLVTIGSDFHKFDNIHPQIGLINTNIKQN